MYRPFEGLCQTARSHSLGVRIALLLHRHRGATKRSLKAVFHFVWLQYIDANAQLRCNATGPSSLARQIWCDREATCVRFPA